MSSTDLKPEAKSESNPVSSKPKGKRGYLDVFMKEGGCEETYTALVDCAERKDKCREASLMLEKCMKARSDYFEPYFSLKKTTVELMLREMETFLHAKLEDRDELLTKFMTRGACKESFIAWTDFCKEAKMNKRSWRQAPPMDTLLKCVEAHSDYYHPLLTVFKTVEEHVREEFKALERRAEAEADAKGGLEK